MITAGGDDLYLAIGGVGSGLEFHDHGGARARSRCRSAPRPSTLHWNRERTRCLCSRADQINAAGPQACPRAALSVRVSAAERVAGALAASTLLTARPLQPRAALPCARPATTFCADRRE